MPQSYTGKMIEVRQSSSQQNQSLRWMKTLVGVILAGSLLFILFKELHSLSNGLEESTKSLEELSNRLAEEEKKNEKLRKELGRVKERMDNILEEFSNIRQKVSRDKRAKDPHTDGSKKFETRCKRLKHCAEKLVNKDINCTMVRNCITSPGKDLIYAYKLVSSTLDNAQATPAKQSVNYGDDLTAQLSWKSYLPSDSSIIAVSKAKFNIFTGGIYYVYCYLRVGEHVNRIVVRTNSSELFSTLPKFTSKGTGVVRMSRLTEIPRHSLLYVEVNFNNSFYENTNDNNEKMNVLFPYFSNEEKSSNSFGMFLVS